MPDPEAFKAFAEKVAAANRMSLVLGSDFTETCQALLGDGNESKRRAIVRCFGSLVDGYAAVMKNTALSICELWGRHLNPFLKDKSQERGISSIYRIVTSYKLISEFLPTSPLTRLDNERTRRLSAAIALRNRIVHPESIEDLSVSFEELGPLIETANGFTNDFTAFCHWSSEEQQAMLWATGKQRVRITNKIGRNDPCPCNSGKKYKHCCGLR